MDIYGFLDSKDVAEYWRKIKFAPGAAEAAFIVYLCEKATLEQKHAAWREIIDTMPDCSLKARINMIPIPSLHDFLRRYMDAQNKMMRDFVKGENSIWQYKFLCEDGDWFDDARNVYSSMQDCLAAIDRDRDNGRKIALTEINKYTFVSGEKSKWALLTLNGNNEPMNIRKSLSDDDFRFTFDGMWFAFPAPFKRGDILISHDGPRGYNKCGKTVFVLDSLPIWDKKTAVKNGIDARKAKSFDNALALHISDGKSSDMSANGYFISDDGSVRFDRFGNYTSFEYCREPLTGADRSLKALSSYLKNQIDLELFLNAYRLIIDEKKADDSRAAFKWSPDKTLELIGLKNK